MTHEMTVNDVRYSVDEDADTSLLQVLRENLGLKGTRFGCGVGLCGACFVLLDGQATPSCDTPLWAAEGKEVVTIEGLGGPGDLHPLQQAFLDEQAAQCGYCLSGVLISAAALLTRDPAPDEAEVAAALDRNLCRCGAQRRMIRAVVRAAKDQQ
ncbi:MAG: nicotinate dehydrogenase subunit [Streptosporangiaceae bacterium]|nr:nicotinate dehydrogenase subunit [Streptosporangiaceae bacterium]